jgi:hypothetical protein
VRSRLSSTRPLRLLRMDEMAVAAAFGLDNRISTEKPYGRTQAWSAAWRAWYPDLDGVAFLGRKSAPHRNLACTWTAAPTHWRSRPTARSPSCATTACAPA